MTCSNLYDLPLLPEDVDYSFLDDPVGSFTARLGTCTHKNENEDENRIRDRIVTAPLAPKMSLFAADDVEETEVRGNSGTHEGANCNERTIQHQWFASEGQVLASNRSVDNLGLGNFEPTVYDFSGGGEQDDINTPINQEHDTDASQAHVLRPSENVFQRVSGFSYNLGRPVSFIRNAHRITQDTMNAHEVSVESELRRLCHQIDVFCGFSINSHYTYHEVERIVLSRLSDRIHQFQKDAIEPRVGVFGPRNDKYIQSLPFVEDRLFNILNVGLQRQELFGSGCWEWTPSDIVDVIGSCWLEARIWQLELLDACIKELERQNYALGVSNM